MARSTQKILKDYLSTILVAVGIALLIRGFFLEAYQIPTVSSHFSMSPTLLPGDTIFISKWPYWMRSSLSPKLFPVRYRDVAPERGEVVVFADSLHFVGRVIGLPGDTIALKNGSIFLNGHSLRDSATGREKIYGAHRKVPFDISYPIGRDHPLMKDFGPELVPDQSVFVIGDSRTAPDPKKGKGWEIIPFSAIIGKVLWIWLSIDPQESGWVPHFRFERMFRRVQSL